MINLIFTVLGFLIAIVPALLVTWWIGKRVYIVGHYWFYAKWKQ